RDPPGCPRRPSGDQARRARTDEPAGGDADLPRPGLRPRAVRVDAGRRRSRRSGRLQPVRGGRVKGQVRGLVGDVGGTNARFALVDQEGHIRFAKSFACQDYSSLAEIIETYLASTAGKRRPTRAAIAVAGPVVDGEIQFTNLA